MANSSRAFAGFNSSSPSSSSSTLIPLGQIYPHYSKLDARELWKASSFAKAVGPSLSLSLGLDDEDDEYSGLDGWKIRVEEARRARARLRSGMTDVQPISFPMQSAEHSHQHQSQSHQHPHQQYQQPLQPHSGHHHMPLHSTSHFSQHTPPILQPNQHQHYAHLTPPPTSSMQLSHHYSASPLQHQQFSSKKAEPIRQAVLSAAASSQPAVSFESDIPPQHHHHHYQQSHHHYGQQQRPMDTPYSSVIPNVTSQMEAYIPPSSNGFEGETDALAYALGLTSYTTSPQAGKFGVRPVGLVGSSGIHGQQQPWAAISPAVSSEQQGDQSYPPMQSQEQPSSSHDETYENSGLSYFSEFGMANQASNNQQMSILHQLGLQGIVDISTPVNTEGDHGEVLNGPVTSRASLERGSSDSHHRPNQWLQTIRGIN
ncbi:hypothetical protein CBS101457_005380 [Exobasidium rhododendri]|nr:hypothetical protein CBS101457_005380 [Exobasidium rhododendri]